MYVCGCVRGCVSGLVRGGDGNGIRCFIIFYCVTLPTDGVVSKSSVR